MTTETTARMTYVDYFQPESETEHKRGNRGEDVPDYCVNCHRPFMDHVNGKCPITEPYCGCGLRTATQTD